MLEKCYGEDVIVYIFINIILVWLSKKKSLEIFWGVIMWLFGYNYKYRIIGMFYRFLFLNYFCY